jgi:alkylation response protein AidB-like acyl-CoA dehydrogenase
MSTPVPAADAAPICAQVEAAPGIARLRELLGDSVDIGAEMITAILEEASRFAVAELAPLNPELDRHGCRLENGRVRTAPGHAEAWKAFAEAGWLGIDQPVEHGGQALPVLALAACQEIFDRSSVAFCMAPTANRAAARLLGAHAQDDIKSEWLPKLASGEWAATICISEPDAGSDVGRIRTLAAPDGDGQWRVTGEKIWISYGDHDLAGRIGHCLLARTPGAAPGAAGLSLFLVPDIDASGARNAIVVRRIEEKLGLHGSPTCALGFEGATGRLIGVEGRGLAQLFTMIAVMRLMVAVQGLGVASSAADVALAYAEERRQGGRPDASPVPIAEHADVQRLLLGMVARVETLRGLILAAAVQTDLMRLEPDVEARNKAQALSQWLLPIAKTLGGEAAFDTASDAIQVLGGAGYVKDWPVEQALRDSRVFAIFEGTSGIQALDLVHRRLRRDEAKGLKAFLALARADIAEGGASAEGSAALIEVLELLERAAARLMDDKGADAVAYAFLRLAGVAATGWIGFRLSRLSGQGPAVARLVSAGRYWLSDLTARARLEAARIDAGAGPLELFANVRARG